MLISASLAFVFFKKRILNNYSFNLRIIMFSLLSTALISGFAAIYCISLLFSKNNGITNIQRPDTGEGNSTISLNVDSQFYSGPIDIEIQEKEMTFDEALKIFSSYRDTLDKSVLNGNPSFLNVSSPLCFPSSIGDENIEISWYISNPEIIDYTGDIIDENFTNEQENVEIIATLSLNEHTAQICYYITVSKSLLSPREELTGYINTIINSDTFKHQSNVNLPSKMNGTSLHFTENKSDLPPIHFYNFYNNNSNTIYISRT